MNDIEKNDDNGRLAHVVRSGMAVFVVLLIVAMFPVSSRPAIDVKILVYQIAACALGGLWLVGAVAGRVPLRWPRIFGLILALMLIRHHASVHVAGSPAAAYLELSRTFCMMVLLLVASQVYSSARQARPLLIAICVGVGLSSVYAFAQKAGIDPFPWEESQRETATYLEMPGTFGNPNIAGHALILALILAGYLTTVRSTRWCVLFVPLFASHLYLTHFRAGLLALVAGLVVAAFASMVVRRRRTPAWTARVTVSAMLVVGAVAAVLALGYVYTASSNQRLLDDSMLLRYNAYYGAAQMIAAEPVDGYGPGMYAIENPPYWTQYEQRWLAEKHLLNEHVHSDVLEAWVETGFVGAAMYVLFLLAGVYYSIRHAAESEGDARRFALALTAFFVAFAVDGLFGFNSRVPVTAVMLFLFAGVLEGVCRPALDRSSERTLVITRVVAIALTGALVLSAFFNTRDFAANVSRQSAQNALAFRAIADADLLSTRALRLAAYDPAAHVTRADVESRLGYPDRAIQQYESALRLRPHDVSILVGLARTHLSSAVASAEEGDREESLRGLDRVVETAKHAQQLCPYLPDADEVLGRAALAKAHLQETELYTAHEQEAETHFLTALRNGAENVGVLFTLVAECRSIAGDYDGAEEYLDKAIGTDSAGQGTWSSYLQFASRTGRFDALKSALGSAIARADRLEDQQLGGRLRAWRARAFVLSGRSSHDVADEFDQSLRGAPDTAQIWEDYAAAARASASEERFLDALRNTASTLPHVAALKPAISETPRKPVRAAVALHELAGRVMTPGYVELRTEDLAWALDYLQDALLEPATADSDRVEGLAHIASAYELLGLIPEAVDAYQLIAEHATGPTYFAAVIKGGSLLVTLSRFEDAVTLFEMALKQDRNSMPLRLGYARALHASGKPAAARMELNALRTQFNLDSEQQAAVDEALDALSR